MEISKIKNLYPTEVRLKNQQILNLRLMNENDIEEVFNLFSKLPDSDKLYLKVDVSKKSAIKEWADRIKEELAVTILAETDQTLCAEATLHQQEAGWSKNVGDIRINVAPEYRGCGIATVLCAKICWIAQIIKIEKIMAELIPEQKKALKIFQNFGFEREAKLSDHIRDIEGKKHDLIILANHTKKLLKEIHSHMLYTDPQHGQEY